MRLKSIVPVLALASIAGIYACTDSSIETTDPIYSDTMVSNFQLLTDDSICENLSGVYFSINLKEGFIFNPDSLPFGTRIDSLFTNVSIPTGASASYIVKYPNKPEETIKYDADDNKAINFSNGDVTLRVQAYSGTFSRDYKIRVNVHKLLTDTMMWSKLESRDLPAGIEGPISQQTVRFKDAFYTLTQGSGGYVIARNENPASDDWTYITPDFSFTPEVNGFAATSDAMYLRDSKTGHLYTSTDGKSWKDLGFKIYSITGAYTDQLIYINESEGKYTINQYPATKSEAMPEGFPVSGASYPVEFKNEWTVSPQIIITGGAKADGKLSADTWGFDGENWANLSKRSLPQGVMSPMVVPYFLAVVDSSWVMTKYSIMLAVGGHNQNGNLIEDVYVSPDLGMTWQLADKMLQLPEGMPDLYGARGFIDNVMLAEKPAEGNSAPKHSNALEAKWKQIKLNSPTLLSRNPVVNGMARISKPVTEWECPYIYMFGGKDAAGKLNTALWRGALAWFTIKPIL